MQSDTLNELPSREVTARRFEDWAASNDLFGRYCDFGDIIEWYIEGKLVVASDDEDRTDG